jgi:O-antigen/teichoic acid export membrane protein
MNLLKASLQIFTSKVARSLLVFLATVYFARELGAAGVGRFFLFQAALGFSALVVDMGIGQALEKRISEGRRTTRILSTGVLLKFSIMAPSFLLIYLFRSEVDSYLGDGLWVFLVLGLTVYELNRIAERGLYGQLSPENTADIEILRYVIWALVGAGLVDRGYGPDGLIIGLLFGYAISFVIGMWRLKVIPTYPKISDARSLIAFSKYAFVSRSSGFVYNWTDILILGLLSTQAAVGAYEIAWKIATFVNLIGSVVARTMFPQISHWTASENTSKIETIFPDVILASLILVIPAFTGSIYIGDDILAIVFGEEFAVAGLALVILLGGKIIQACNMSIGFIITGMDYPRLTAISSGLAVIGNVVLNIVLIHYFGVVGAAVGTSTALGLALMMNYYYSMPLVDLMFPRTGILICIVASLNMLLVILLLGRYIVIDSISALLTVFGLGVIVYLAQLAASKTMREKFRQFRTVVY